MALAVEISQPERLLGREMDAARRRRPDAIFCRRPARRRHRFTRPTHRMTSPSGKYVRIATVYWLRYRTFLLGKKKWPCHLLLPREMKGLFLD